MATFAAPVTYVCTYPAFSTEQGIQSTGNDLVLQFVFDEDRKKAHRVKADGAQDVQVIQDDTGGITFIEVNDAVNVMVTTFDSTGKSVNSQNITSNGELLPAQYYGRCEAKTSGINKN